MYILDVNETTLDGHNSRHVCLQLHRLEEKCERIFPLLLQYYQSIMAAGVRFSKGG
jgi:hypothetical protein